MTPCDSGLEIACDLGLEIAAFLKLPRDCRSQFDANDRMHCGCDAASTYYNCNQLITRLWIVLVKSVCVTMMF